MAATEFEFVSLPDKARQALDGISHALCSSLLLVDDAFALVIRHSYGLDAFHRAFQPLNVLSIDVELPLPAEALRLRADSADGTRSQHAAENGDGWDEWQWDERTEAAAATSAAAARPTSASSISASPSPPLTALLSCSLTPPVVSRLAAVVAALRSDASYASSRLHVYSAVSSQCHESAGLSAYSAIEARLPPPCSVHHLPLSYSLLLPSVFFLPSASSLSFTGARQKAETAAPDVLPSLAALSSLVKGRPAAGAAVVGAHDGQTARQHSAAPDPSSDKSHSSSASWSESSASAVSSISAALSSLLIHLRLRPDVFSSGRVGHRVGRAVRDAMARHLHSTTGAGSTKQGKAASRSSGPSQQPQTQQAWQVASVVLVDRLHDMAAACSHPAHVLDHVYYTQRRAAAEAPFLAISPSASHSAVNALHHSGDKDCAMLLNALVSEPLSSVLRVASRLVASSLPAELSTGRRKGDVTVAQLRERVAQLEGHLGSLCAHHGLHQMTSALVRAEADEAESDSDDAASSAGSRWRQLQSLERICLSSLPSGQSAASSNSPLATLVDLLQAPSAAAGSRSLPLLSLLALSSFVFSALGDLPLRPSDERRYRAALLRRVQVDRAHDDVVARLVGSAEDVEPFVERATTLLQQMRYARATFSAPQLSGLLALDSGEPRVEPFVARLLGLCLDPAQSASDLEQHQQPAELSAFDQLRLGAKESLRAVTAQRSGAGGGAAAAAAGHNVQQSLSSFLSLGSSVVNKVTSSLSSSIAGGGSHAPAHPSQHSTLLFVVLGDVSWLEVSEMLKVAALRPACNVLIGCTGVADAEEMAWKTFALPGSVSAREA